MSRGLLVFLAMCAFAIAMVPRDRRAVNPDEQAEQETTTQGITLCDPTTPCAWSIYKPENKMIDLNITNNYCQCPAELVCARDQDDSGASCYIFRCRKPGYDMGESTDTTDSTDTTES